MITGVSPEKLLGTLISLSSHSVSIWVVWLVQANGVRGAGQGECMRQKGGIHVVAEDKDRRTPEG